MDHTYKYIHKHMDHTYKWIIQKHTINENTETPEYKWIYQRTTVSQQRKQKLYSLHREKKEGTSI